ncbi:MAG: hypothetical protein ACM3MG_02705 [Bacillota bacterium]
MVKWISLGFLVLVYGQTLLAATETSPYYKPSRSLYSKKIKAEKKVTSKGFSLVIPSVVYHGTKPGVDASSSMPRKVDSGGNTVVTPGLGLQYVSDSGLLVLGAVVKDCYDNLAGTFQIGELFEISDRTNWGVTFGVYARQTPMKCTSYSDGFNTGTDCYELDSYRLKFNSSVNGYPIDIIPMPFLHFTTALYKSREFQVNFKVMSNIVLNEFGIAVPF